MERERLYSHRQIDRGELCLFVVPKITRRGIVECPWRDALFIFAPPA